MQDEGWNKLSGLIGRVDWTVGVRLASFKTVAISLELLQPFQRLEIMA